MNGRTNAWPQNAVEFLLARAMAGDSAMMIAKRLGADFNFKISRNGVIGKLHRMKDKDDTIQGFAGRPVDGPRASEIKRSPRPRADNSAIVRRRTHSEESRTRANVRAAEITEALRMNKGVTLPPDCRPVPIFEVTGCREVVDPTPYKQLFCNSRQAAGSSYCPLHHAKNHAGFVRAQDKDAAE